MKKYEIIGKLVVLHSGKAPVFPRVMMFFFSFISFLLPIFGIILSIISKNGIHFGHFLSLVIFGLLGFYLLRVVLWNTYGKETFNFENDLISYEADYGWFKDRVKEISKDGLTFSIQKVGYEDENKAVLTMNSGSQKIKSATKMVTEDIEELLSKLHGILDQND